jgi:HlyD family secretion protein
MPTAHTAARLTHPQTKAIVLQREGCPGKMTKPSRRFWFILTVVVGALAVLTLIAGLGSEQAVPVTVTRVRRGDLSQTIRATGHVEPEGRIRISSRVTGELVELNVEEGSVVGKGDLLAVINPGIGEQQVDQRQAQLKSLEASVGAEQAKLTRARAKHQNSSNLFKRGLVSSAEVADAQEEMRMAKAQFEAAKHRVAQARAELAEEQTKLGFNRVTAPAAGTVLSVERRPGERVRGGSEEVEDILLTLAPLDRMKVDIEVSESDVVELKRQDDAEVRVRALQGVVVPAAIESIASSATIYNRGQLNELTRFKVTIVLKEFPPRIRPGMTAEVLLVAKTRENVLIVPYSAVTTRTFEDEPPRTDSDGANPEDAGTWAASSDSAQPLMVYVVHEGRAVAKRVATGIVAETEVEIVAGLTQEDVVISGPFDVVSQTLRSGMRVHAPNPSPDLRTDVTTSLATDPRP